LTLGEEFQDTMTGVVLEGQWTRDGSPGVSDDKYGIDKIVRTGDDQWTFHARVEAKGQTMMVPWPLQVKWAGDTPVITLTDKACLAWGLTVRAWRSIAANMPEHAAAGTAAAKYSGGLSGSNWRGSCKK